MTHTPLDALKYSAAYAKQQIDVALDRIGCVVGITDELEAALEPMMEQLEALSHSLVAQLAPWCGNRAEWFTYSDGRPLQTELPLGHTTFEHLWHPDPAHDPPAPRLTELMTGIEHDGLVLAEVLYERPSRIVVRVSGEVFESIQGGETR